MAQKKKTRIFGGKKSRPSGVLHSFGDIAASKTINKNRLTYTTIAFVLIPLLSIVPFFTLNNDTKAAAASYSWPANNDWTTETLHSATTNITKTVSNVSMNAPLPTNTFATDVVATGLDTIWSMQFAPDGKMYFSERPGRVRVMENGSVNPTPVLTISGTETLSAEEGLQGIALDPNFASNGYMYVYYTFTAADSSMKNRVARYTVQNNTTVGTPLTLVDNIPGSRFHNGGRIAFGPDGKLYIAIGAADSDAAAQDINSTAGKILRINSDGTYPADNPFPDSPVYSLGHRNPQGLAWHPVSGQLWSTEHGPTGTAPFCCHDEVNIITPGGNYGWPKYYGTLTNSTYAGLNVVNPIYPVYESGDGKWAPGGTMFYTGDQFGGAWKTSLIWVGLGFQNAGGRALYRLQLGTDNTTPGILDKYLENQFGRLRDVVQGPKGELYVSTSNRDGRGQPVAEDDRIVRLRPTFPDSGTGSFVLKFDAGSNQQADPNSITANTNLPEGTSVSYETRSSSDNVSFTAFSPDINATPAGRYLEIKVNLSSSKAGASPSLSNLTLNYESIAAPASYCANSTSFICEDFTTSAANFTTAGGTWTVSGGKYVLSNYLTSGTGAYNKSLHNKSVSGDYKASAKITQVGRPDAYNDIALIFGYVDNNNYWYADFAETNSGSNNHGLFRVSNGSRSQILDFSSTYLTKDGSTYNIRVERTGTNIKVFRDNVQVVSTTQTTPATGKVGLGTINDPASFDDLEVTTTTTTTPPPPPPPGPTPPPPAPTGFCSGKTFVLCEEFSAANTNFTNSGGTWTVSGGKYVLTNQLTGGNGVVHNRSIHNTTVGNNFTMSAKVTTTPTSSTANDLALLFGYTNSTNYWVISLAENNSTGNHGLFRIVNNSWTQVVDFPSSASLADGTTYDIRVEKIGTSIKVFRNNVQIISSTQSTLPASGNVGLASINDPASFDDFIVTSQ